MDKKTCYLNYNTVSIHSSWLVVSSFRCCTERSICMYIALLLSVHHCRRRYFSSVELSRGEDTNLGELPKLLWFLIQFKHWCIHLCTSDQVSNNNFKMIPFATQSIVYKQHNDPQVVSFYQNVNLGPKVESVALLT